MSILLCSSKSKPNVMAIVDGKLSALPLVSPQCMSFCFEYFRSEDYHEMHWGQSCSSEDEPFPLIINFTFSSPEFASQKFCTTTLHWRWWRRKCKVYLEGDAKGKAMWSQTSAGFNLLWTWLSAAALNSYFSGRVQSVRAEGFLSDPLSLSKGVHQGSLLGPTLFKIDINNVAYAAGSSHIHLYADDTILYISIQSLNTALTTLQHSFKSIQLASSNLHLLLNTNKTKCFNRIYFKSPAPSKSPPWMGQNSNLSIPINTWLFGSTVQSPSKFISTCNSPKSEQELVSYNVIKHLLPTLQSTPWLKWQFSQSWIMAT